MKKNNKLLKISLILWIVLPLAVLIPFFLYTSGKDNTSKVNLVNEISICADRDGVYSFEDMESINFQNFKTSKLSGSLSDDIYWVKINLPERTPSNTKYNHVYLLDIAKPQLDSISYRQIDEQGKILAEGSLGRKYPFEQRILQHKDYVIPLENYEGTSTMYLSIHTKSYLQLPISIWRWEDFSEYSFTTQFANGVFYGALIIMAFYNIVLGITLKEKNYFYFVGCILAYSLLQLVWDGYSYQYLWSELPGWDLLANPFFINVCSLFLLLFSKSFLRVDKNRKVLNLCYNVLFGVAGVAMVLVFVLPVHISIYIGMGIAFLSIIMGVLSVIIKRELTKAEVIYIGAWQVLLAGNILNILSGLKLISYSQIIKSYPKIGVILLVVLFSLALSERINQVELQKKMETEKRQLMNNFHEMNKKITGESDILLAFQHLLSDFKHITGYEKGVAVLISGEDGQDLEVYSDDTQDVKVVSLEEYRFEELINGIEDHRIGTLDRIFYHSIIRTANVSTARVISLVNRGQRRGFIVLYSSIYREINPMVEETVLEYANQFAMTIDNILLLNEITKVAQTDGLTQLYNRTHFFKYAQDMFENEKDIISLAVLMIDVDYFKLVNDTYGHKVGDVVLQSIVSIMKDTVEKNGIIGRYGGEEFVIAIPNQTCETVKELAQAIRLAVEHAEIKVEDFILKVTISIGISHKKRETKSIFTLTEEADQALYKAKEKGRNQIYLVRIHE